MKNVIFVRWIGGTRTVGPYGKVAIQNGDIRELVSSNGQTAWITGPNGAGLYGAVSCADFEIL